MSARLLSAALVAVLLLAAAGVTGCAKRVGVGGPGTSVPTTGATTEAATQAPAAGSGDVVPASSGTAPTSVGTKALDVGSVDRQLDRMQKELDDLSMPADSDFDGAGSAVY